MAEVVIEPPKGDTASAPTQSHSESATGPSSKKRPALEKDSEPRKKSRSVFAQVFGTLKKAQAEDAIDKTTDSVRKRREIDARIYGKITRDVNLVRRQDEAKRDRHNASRKEEELAIKDEVMKFRQNCFPRLAGFLLTSDDIPPDTDENKELPIERSSSPGPGEAPGASGPTLKKTLTHPSPLKQPPALYFIPAILTAAQKKFLDSQQVTVKEILVEEQKEWEETKKSGLEEVNKLRKNAEEALAPAKEKEEEDRKKDEEARKRDDEELPNASSVPGTQPDEEMEVETENSVARGMDAEERIEY